MIISVLAAKIWYLIIKCTVFIEPPCICRRIHVAGYTLLVRDTCWLHLSDIITIHLCHGRLVSLCIQQQTGDKLATILSPIEDTCRRRQVDTTCVRQHVSWCKRGFTDRQQTTLVLHWWCKARCLSADCCYSARKHAEVQYITSSILSERFSKLRFICVPCCADEMYAL